MPIKKKKPASADALTQKLYDAQFDKADAIAAANLKYKAAEAAVIGQVVARQSAILELTASLNDEAIALGEVLNLTEVPTATDEEA